MEKRIWNQLKKAVIITAAVGILGAGAVSAAEFEVAELYVPAVGLKQSAQWIDEEKFQAELTLEVSGLKELYKSQQENTASENGQLQMENSTWDGEVREAEAAENNQDASGRGIFSSGRILGRGCGKHRTAGNKYSEVERIHIL